MTYLGHFVALNETRKDLVNVKDIFNYPALKDLQQLQSFLGMLNYYDMFIK